MPGEEKILSDANRAKLDGIVQQMSANKESDENIKAVVEDFKSKYSEQPLKKKVELSPSDFQSTQKPFSLPSSTENTTSSLTTGQLEQQNEVPKLSAATSMGATPSFNPQSNVETREQTVVKTPLSQPIYEPIVEPKTLTEKVQKVKNIQDKSELGNRLMKGMLEEQFPASKEIKPENALGAKEAYADKTYGKVLQKLPPEAIKGHEQEVLSYLKTNDYDADKLFQGAMNDEQKFNLIQEAIKGKKETLNTRLQHYKESGVNQAADDYLTLFNQQKDLTDEANALAGDIAKIKSENTSNAGVNSKEYTEKVNKYNELAKKHQEVAEQLKEYEPVKEHILNYINDIGKSNEIANQDEQMLNSLPIAKENINKQKQAEEGKKEYNALEDIGTKLANGVVSAVQNVASFIPKQAGDLEKAVSGRKGYQFGDKVADFLTGNDAKPFIESTKYNDITKFNPLKEPGGFLRSLGGGIAQQFPVMASMALTDNYLNPALTKALGQGSKLLKMTNATAKSDALSTTLSGYINSYKQYSDEANKLGLDPRTGLAYSASMAMLEGLSENILPDKNLFTPKVKKKFLGEYIEDISKGMKPVDASKKIVKSFIKDGTKEFGEEFIVDMGKYLNQKSISLDNPNIKAELPSLNEMINTFAISFTMGGAASAINTKRGINTEQNLAYLSAAKDIETTKETLNKLIENGTLTKEEGLKFIDNVNKFKKNEALVPADISDVKKADVIENLNKIDELQQKIDDPNIAEPIKKTYQKAQNEYQSNVDNILKDGQYELNFQNDVREKDAHEHAKLEDEWMKEFEAKHLTPPSEQQEKQTQETPEITQPIKTEEDATKNRKIEASNQPKHQNGDESGQATETGSSDSLLQSGQEQQQEKEVTVPTPQKNVAEKPSPKAEEETATPKKEKVTPKNELVDFEEELEAKQGDDEASVKKLNNDIEALKSYKDKGVAEKKFKAIIERAFKMKEEKKISKPTYTQYRNIAQQVLGPKISVGAENAKLKIEQIKEEVKKSLLGQEYKKVILSAPGFGPAQVAHLIDVTANLAKKAIDAGYTVSEAITKAVEHAKSHPFYNKLVENKELDEGKFKEVVSKNFKEAEKETEQPKVKAETKETPTKEEPKTEPKKEEPENKGSGIKKALVSDDIIKNVDLEKISDTEMQGLAKKIIDTGEVKPEKVVNEILKQHRALQPKEVVALIYYKTQLDNELNDAYEEKNRLIEEGETTGEIDAEIVDLEQKRENFDEVSVITASQQSLAFRLRQGMRDEQYNLITEINRYKATNGGEISPEAEAKIRDLINRQKEDSARIAKLEKEKEEQAIEIAHLNIIEEIAREKTLEKSKTITQKSKELADKVRKLKSKPFKFVTFDGKEVDIQQKGGISMNGLIELAAKTIETTGKTIDGVNAVIKFVKTHKWFEKLTPEDKDRLLEQIRDYFTKPEKEIAKPQINEDGKLIIPHSLIRSIYQSGATDINEIVKSVKEQIDLPDITDRQIRDAITRYGKTVNLNKDELEAGIRQAKRIGRLISQLEDIQKKEKPKRSGLQRDKISDEERRLMKEVKREMSYLPEDPEENAQLLKTALETKKERLRNRITDLENQIANGEKTKKAKGVELDEEAKDLKEKADKLRSELEAIEGKAEITDEQRLERMKTYTKNRIFAFENKIKNKDFAKTEKKKPISDEELTKARGDLAEAKDEFEKLQYENELKNRSKAEKLGHLMLGVLNIPRAFKLGFDLSAIGVQGLRRLSTSPLQSARAFKDMMQQAFSEKAQKEWQKALKGQEYYSVLKAAGAAFTDTDGKLSVREENFSNDLVKLAFKGLFNKKIGIDKANVYEISNRAFSGYLNSIRLQGYLEGFKALEHKGKTFESHPYDYKSWVKYINNITGRGSLGKAGNVSELAQFIFTSPRKMISELNLINPHFWGNIVKKDVGKDYNYQLTPTVARKAFADYALGMGITAVASALARAAFAGSADDDDDFTDPRSSNFMGVKIKDDKGGFTVVNLFGSYKTEAVLISRIIAELANKKGYMNTRTGKLQKLGDVPGTKGTELFASFIANKLSPTVQLLWKRLLKSKNYDVKEEAKSLFIPANVENFMQTYKDYPTETAVALSMLALYGISETAVKKPEKKKK